jgi:hypothetical protein
MKISLVSEKQTTCRNRFLHIAKANLCNALCCLSDHSVGSLLELIVPFCSLVCTILVRFGKFLEKVYCASASACAKNVQSISVGCFVGA